MAALAEAVQQAAGESVELAYADRGYTGEEAAEAAKATGMRLEVVKHPGAKKGFVLLPRRWVAERSFAWATRFRRLAKYYERLPETVAGLHFVAFACLFPPPSDHRAWVESITASNEERPSASPSATLRDGGSARRDSQWTRLCGNAARRTPEPSLAVQPPLIENRL